MHNSPSINCVTTTQLILNNLELSAWIRVLLARLLFRLKKFHAVTTLRMSGATHPIAHLHLRRPEFQQHCCENLRFRSCNSWSYLYFTFRFLYHDDMVIDQEYTDPRHHIAQVTKFCIVTPNICGFSVCYLLHVTVLVPGVLRWLVDFCKICVLPVARPLSSM
jgi:hypothetical protein